MRSGRKPLRFSEALAHPDDPLPNHLEHVARQALASVRTATIETQWIAFLTGLCHDVGKGTPFFQDYLLSVVKKRSALTSHAMSGAAFSWWLSGRLGLPLWVRMAVCIGVTRHHGALAFPTWLEPIIACQYDISENAQLLRQLKNLDLSGILEWLRKAIESENLWEESEFFSTDGITVEAIKQSVEDRESAKRSTLRKAFTCLEQSVAFLAGFGAVLNADKVHSATGATFERQALPVSLVSDYKAHKFNAAVSEMNLRREAIAEEVKRTWLENSERELFTLTAPTGSGKTLTVMDAALALREQLEKSRSAPARIIYCLPFTSVIDQNHEILRQIVSLSGLPDREDILLKHHHLSEGLFRTKDSEYLPDGAGQLLTESWQSEIVVTTFHQLLHSLLSGRNQNLKRTAQLAGSIVIMDEVQAVPLRYWDTLRRVFGAVAAVLGTKFVLMTATRPLIFRPDDPAICELLPNHVEHFRTLSRIELHCRHHSPVGLMEFTEKVVEMLGQDFRSTLIVLNRRKAVPVVFARLREAFPNVRVIALSTDFTPWDRRARIRLIRSLLRRNIPCILVSTQLVEAGVDVSFPVVHRDFAPLDSIIQAAGRCNRHDSSEIGKVFLWEILEESDREKRTPLWSRVYDLPLIQVTKEVLGEASSFAEAELLDLGNRYFERCRAREGQIAVDELLVEGNFAGIEDQFQLIPDGPPTSTFFVLKNASDEQLWTRYQTIEADTGLSPLERKRRFRAIRHRFYEHIIQVYAPPDRASPIRPMRAGPDTYTRETGFAGLPEECSTCVF